ncbi:LacI family DNA-binding transcriptional regulator [Mammaliicoccus fleurettii]|uniref:LacI family DNA-binding transcriptional regulator n=1 Tax=Mammaliicoccus fleurettii TaxID=150056 RepID=A0ABS5MMF3_9STAP|nr:MULTISPECIES: LacI family DNA-binding transcriptional regulator [Mammaliicoccus]MBL0847196.1 LacI family DNA-binding transcriptional regulator [Mammaliicoccus fleurettii]MBS3671809.1 LacI family DNA-binding transcriptional regulator [Mammaliicoccus fleurettii]MBS3696836.1 LacI family DNA-binding transcriptional regulator [Mammaliicoccus fleurettii]MEB6202133.1 LacI family DNA-binding transcriptional regulator [Mammaliicoccus fleurettii]MEB7807320.1 LacI family DNA-binding transcriptional re
MTNLKEVARKAGVSPSTVSRVINNHPYVNEEKRNRVLQVIEEINYIPNINAIHLKKGKTNLIGVVIPFSNHPYFSQLIQGISEEAIKLNKKIVLFQTSYDNDQEIDALEMLKLKQLDALIICSRNISLNIIEQYVEYGPISIFEDITHSKLRTTYIDHYKAFYTALNHLYEHGHRNISCAINRKNSTSSLLRIAAYKDFCKEKSLTFNKKMIYENYVLLEDGYILAKDLNKSPTPPSAIIVSGDNTAAGLLLSINNDAKEHLSIIGFENHKISEMLNLTTIEIPLINIGKSLFNQLYDNNITHHFFETKLIKRNSVKNINC